MTIYTLYPDGGLLVKNPSPIGGTWAFVAVTDTGKIHQGWGVLPSRRFEDKLVTNNQTEMWGMLSALHFLPTHARDVVICPDSKVTMLRVFGNYSWKNIPSWMHLAYQDERKRLIHWDTFKTILLDGHPTRAQLATGFGKRGHPVSKYNVLADRLCTEAGERYRATL